MSDLKTTIRKAANAVGVAESAADLIADHLEESGHEIAVNEEKAKQKSQLRVQPAAKPAAGK